MQTDIRKISVGKNYPEGVMHFLVGKSMNLQGVPYVISKIDLNQTYATKDKIAYDIYLTNYTGTVLWKTIYDLPVVIENNINFE
jgi:hypothetical protein